MRTLTDYEKQMILKLHSQGYSSRLIAEEVLGRASAKSTVNDFLKKHKETQEIVKSDGDGPKILFFDVEVTPSVNLAFSRFRAFASPDHVLQEPYLLCYGYAWGLTGEPECVTLPSVGARHYDDIEAVDIVLVEHMWELLDEADIVIAHNAGFDEGWANQQFVKYDLPPPSPYKLVCTLKAAKKTFSLPSNSLDAASKYFGLTRKLDHEGITLWKRCMEWDHSAFSEMATYNLGDIVTLQEFYKKILPYFPSHPNVAHYYNDDKMRCRRCGSENMVEMENDHLYTNVSKFQAYRCGDCGGINRDRINVHSKEKMKNILM